MRSDPYSEALSAIGTVFDDVEVDDELEVLLYDDDITTADENLLSPA